MAETFDTSDEKQVKERKKAHELASETETEELKAVLGTYSGRAFVWRLLDKCEIHTFGYCGDNNFLNNLEGRRFIGGWIEKEVLTDAPGAYIMMRNEAMERVARKKRGKSNG